MFLYQGAYKIAGWKLKFIKIIFHKLKYALNGEV